MKSPLLHFIIALLILAGVLVGYCAWYSIIVAKSNSVTNLQNQIDTETVNRTDSARVTVAEIESDDKTVQKYLVPETGVVAFINNLETLGNSQGTNVNILSVSPGKDALPTLIFSLTSKGTFDAVMRTVGAIEYSPYDLFVSDFSLNQDAKNDWQASLTLVVGSAKSTTATSTP